MDAAPAACPSRLKLLGEPICAVIRSAMSSRCVEYTPASFSTAAIRCACVMRGQGPSSNAARAAHTAASTSWADPAAARAMTSSV